MTATINIQAAQKRVQFTKVVVGTGQNGEKDTTEETCVIEPGESTTLHIHDGFEVGYIKEVDERADNGESDEN